MALELEFGMMFVCSMLGVIGEEIALHRSSVKMLIQFFSLFFKLMLHLFQNNFTKYK